MIKAKLHLSSQAIKDIYADSISSVIWNIETNTFHGQSKISTYLYKILYNKSVDFIRYSSTNKNVQHLELNEDLDSEPNDPGRILESSLDVLTVKEEIKSLGEPCYSIIMDWAYWGYSMAEIASRNVLDNADKAKKKKYYCLQKLRTSLKSKGIY